MENDCILIVDDEERMRKLIKDFLKQKNYNTMEAADGEEALKVFSENQNRIRLILLDVMMPKLDGWSVLRQIRQTSKVPIMMLTARGEEQDELFGFELGVDEYISKPFSPKILVARVEAISKLLARASFLIFKRIELSLLLYISLILLYSFFTEFILETM